MALDRDALKTVMLAATEMQTIGAVALLSLGTAVAAYIVANTDLTFKWVATNTAPPFDTENVTATGKILTCTILLTPSLSTIQGGGLVFMATQMVAGIRLGTFNITQGGWATGPELLSDCPDFSLSIEMTDSRDNAYEQLATKIVDQLKDYQPGTPIAGTHGSYAGATTECVIS